MEAYTYIIIYD